MQNTNFNSQKNMITASTLDIEGLFKTALTARLLMNLSIKMRHLKPKIPYGKTIKESEKPSYKPGKVKMQIKTTIRYYSIPIQLAKL